MDLDDDADALAAVLSFVDGVLARGDADLCDVVDASALSAAPLERSATRSDASSDAPSDLRTACDRLEPPLEVYNGLSALYDANEGPASAAEWGSAHSLGASTSVGSGGDSNSDSSELDGSSHGSQTRAAPLKAALSIPESPPARKRELSKKPRKQRGAYNPNRARDEERKELRRLRVEVGELGEQLSVLRSHRCPRLRWNNSRERLSAASRSMAGGSIASSVWKAMAERQLEKRMEASHENAVIKSRVEENSLTISRMAKLLRSHNVAKATRQFSIQHAHGIFNLAQYRMDPAVVQRLVAEVDRCYREVDKVFQSPNHDVSSIVRSSAPEIRTDSVGNLFSRAFGSKVLPYSVEMTGELAWSQFVECVRPTARCFVDEVVLASEDMVIGRFATELHLDGSKMVAFGWQVKRRYVEADRVVVAWSSLMDPLEFKGQRMTGASYEEVGTYVIHSPPQIPTGFSLLQTCYQVAPSVPMLSVPQDATALAVTEFVLNWLAASIPANHQILEDTLFDRGMKSVGA